MSKLNDEEREDLTSQMELAIHEYAKRKGITPHNDDDNSTDPVIRRYYDTAEETDPSGDLFDRVKYDALLAHVREESAKLLRYRTK